MQNSEHADEIHSNVEDHEIRKSFKSPKRKLCGPNQVSCRSI